MQVITQSQALDNALIDTANWANEQWVHEQFSWMRENAPLRYLSPEGYEPFWNVTRYSDIKEIERNKKLFINDPRPTLGLQMVTQMINKCPGVSIWLGRWCKWTTLII
jgi:hypothetical protein